MMVHPAEGPSLGVAPVQGCTGTAQKNRQSAASEALAEQGPALHGQTRGGVTAPKAEKASKASGRQVRV